MERREEQNIERITTHDLTEEELLLLAALRAPERGKFRVAVERLMTK